MVEVLAGDQRILSRRRSAVVANAPSAAAGDDQGFAEGGAAGALWFERCEHDHELAAHEVEHVGEWVDAQDVVAERELAERADRDAELALGVGRDGDDESGRIDVDVEALVGWEAAADDGGELTGGDRRRRRQQLWCEV